MPAWLLIFLGGGLGALSRYGVVSLLKPSSDPGKFPVDILACNLIGCFLIGLVFAWQNESSPSWLPPLLITGFLGGFTTYSSFGLDTIKLFEAGAVTNALLYVLTTTIGCLALVFLAIKIVK